jgi:hypothetical protein
MSKTSDAAKAASILHHTWGIDGYGQALLVYEAIANTHDLNISDFLEELQAGRWAELEDLSDDEWWENVEALALSIDAAQVYFKTKETT